MNPPNNKSDSTQLLGWSWGDMLIATFASEDDDDDDDNDDEDTRLNASARTLSPRLARVS